MTALKKYGLVEDDLPDFEIPAAPMLERQYRRITAKAQLSQWFRRIAVDVPNLKPLTYRTAMRLAYLVDWSEGYASFDQEGLAREMNVSQRGLQKAIAQLVRHGLTEVEVRRGRGRTNNYWLTLKRC